MTTTSPSERKRRKPTNTFIQDQYEVLEGSFQEGGRFRCKHCNEKEFLWTKKWNATKATAHMQQCQAVNAIIKQEATSKTQAFKKAALRGTTETTTVPSVPATTMPSAPATTMPSVPATSEKKKMLAGELYKAFDPYLLKERIKAKQLCFKLNQTSPLEVGKRKKIMKELIGVEDALIESPFNCDYGYNLKVGKNFYANHGCTILDCNLITIGDNCLLAPNVVISAATHPLDPKLRASGDELTAPVTIGDNVWIGANATISQGVKLGSNVVVGAGAVVTKDMPDNVVCAGVPAKIIRHLEEEELGQGTEEVNQLIEEAIGRI